MRAAFKARLALYALEKDYYCGLFSGTLMALKLTGAITWSWWWVALVVFFMHLVLS
jgi:hypothetical protein